MNIQTERLVLRSNFSDDDLQQLAKLLAVPATARATGVLLPTNPDERYFALIRLLSANHSLVINRRNSRRVIGLLMLSDIYGKEGKKIPHHYELGYLMAEEVRNHGYMTEAVKGMINSLPSTVVLHAETQADNIQSQRVLEKCGFQQREDGKWLCENLHLNSRRV